ncbi:alpha-N-methyltransferase NTM1 [Schizophyllum commune]
MSTEEAVSTPVVEHGIDYWNKQKADEDGVLGGFGTGSLPRIESLGSRLFLLNLLPELCTVPSALKPLDSSPLFTDRRHRALDVGAGVGRVTADTLLHLVSDVVLLEPVEQFIQVALSRGQGKTKAKWRGIEDKSKSVTFVKGTLQAFDPSAPISEQDVSVLGRVGYQPEGEEGGFDVVWCQWCLGHLSDPDLILFLKRSRQSLRGPRSLIVIKENCCSDGPNGEPREAFDEDDSSLTRSDMAWKKAFELAGLRLVREQVQEGLPEGLYVVKM